MAASTSDLLAGNFLEEPVDFILFCLSKADDVKVVFALGVGHLHDLPFEPTHSAQTKLAVCNPLVFVDPNRSIKQTFATWEVAAVLAEVLAALPFVPGRHALIVATKSDLCCRIGRLRLRQPTPGPRIGRGAKVLRKARLARFIRLGERQQALRGDRSEHRGFHIFYA